MVIIFSPQDYSPLEYEEFMHDKVNYYEVNQDFFDQDPLGVLGSEEKSGKLLNRLAELFSGKHGKLKPPR